MTSATGAAAPDPWPAPGVPEAPTEEAVTLPGGLRLALRVRGRDGSARPFLLVHGLASNARLWDAASAVLAAAGHPVAAVDLRGHGRSAELNDGGPEAGYDTGTCAADLAALVDVLGWAGRRPVVAGQSWGAHVVGALAATNPALVGGVACVDGGWFRLADAFASFDECWAALAPPQFDDWRWADLVARIHAGHGEGWPPGAAEAALGNLRETPDGGVRAVLTRARHRSILASMFAEDPAAWQSRVGAPTLLVSTVAEQPAPGEPERAADTRARVLAALTRLPRGRARWYAGAHHDVHLQRPADVAADLIALAGEVDATNEGAPA